MGAKTYKIFGGTFMWSKSIKNTSEVGSGLKRRLNLRWKNRTSTIIGWYLLKQDDGDIKTFIISSFMSQIFQSIFLLERKGTVWVPLSFVEGDTCLTVECWAPGWQRWEVAMIFVPCFPFSLSVLLE